MALNLRWSPSELVNHPLAKQAMTALSDPNIMKMLQNPETQQMVMSFLTGGRQAAAEEGTGTFNPTA